MRLGWWCTTATTGSTSRYPVSDSRSIRSLTITGSSKTRSNTLTCRPAPTYRFLKGVQKAIPRMETQSGHDQVQFFSRRSMLICT